MPPHGGVTANGAVDPLNNYIQSRLQQARNLVESWLRGHKEFVRVKKELRAVIHVFNQLASKRPDKDRRARQLAESSFGSTIRERVGNLLAKSKSTLEGALLLVAQSVACRAFSSLADLENYVAKTLHFRLKELADSDASDPARAQRKDVRWLRKAEAALRQQSNGREPSDEELCRFLGWSPERLHKTRVISRTVSYEDYMDDQADPAV